MSRLRRALTLALLAGGLGQVPPVAADARSSLLGIEAEYKAAIKRVTPATVFCKAQNAERWQPGSSGVIVSRRGLVLSDGDAALVLKRVESGREVRLERRDDDLVVVRVPEVKTGRFKSYTAKVVRLDRAADTILLRIQDPPAGGFPAFLPIGSSDDLAVGDVTFAMGNAFGISDDGLPSLTAGVVASVKSFPTPGTSGLHETIYTSAAVNLGANGGPLVDIEGRLVGTISGYVTPDAQSPYQCLGAVVPVQRLQAVYAGLPEAAEAFPERKPARARSTQASHLAAAYRAAAQAGYAGVASLMLGRDQPYDVLIPLPQGGRMPLVRYKGPVSAVVLRGDGTLVTSLYNLTTMVPLDGPPDLSTPLAPDLTLESGLVGLARMRACFSDGRSASVRLVGLHPRLGLAYLKADLPAGYVLPTFRPAPAADLREGRFVLALGNPFGDAPPPGPLLTVGVLSKRHAEGSPNPWRGNWQTDAGVTDANCGGALVDMQARIVGVVHQWNPLRLGRASGLGFVVPWERAVAGLAEVGEGRVFRRGLLGLTFDADVDIALVDSVVADGPASRAGIKPNDHLIEVDGQAVASVAEAQRSLAFRWEGEALPLLVLRRGAKKPVELTVVLGARPEPAAAVASLPPPPVSEPAPPAPPVPPAPAVEPTGEAPPPAPALPEPPDAPR